MRIEFDATAPVVEDVVVNAAVENYSHEANEALRDGVKAAQAGDRLRARTALLRAAELDPTSESAWLWLASISEYPEELLVFLNNVLDINPYNGRALEWMGATKSLLAKTFVQRGIDAAGGGQADFAAQCFHQALENDQRSSEAWMWLAKLADSPEGKLSYLEKVVEIDPTNEEARNEYQAANNAINQSLLAEARAAAVAGRKADANDLLDAFIEVNPDSEDGWILRSLLADDFAEKIAAFEQVIAINPDNLTARSGIESLKSIMAMVAPAAEPAPPAEPLHAEPVHADPVPAAFSPAEPAPATENTAYVIESERKADPGALHDKSPTQDLVFPEAAAEFHERMTGENPVDEVTESPDIASAGETWGMNTVAFSFAFPAGEMAAAEEPVAAGMMSAVIEPEVVPVEAIDEQDDNLYETETYEPVPSPFDDPDFQPIPQSLEDIDPGPQFTPDPVRYEEMEVPVDTAVAFHYTPEIVEEAYSEPEEMVEAGVEDAIPMPFDFSVPVALANTGYETTIVRNEPQSNTASGSTACAFCNGENPSQAFTCGHCLATLTLSDLEMLLANSHADKGKVREAARSLENEKELRPLSEVELTNLGIAHLNLRDFQTGYQYLQEASQLNPNNVVLSGQVNSLHIRLDEIKRQGEATDAMPKEKKILVVDDSATVRKLIAGKLEKCGHEVFCAADGVEAIEQLDTVVPDLILLDITMPRMDGYQVCKVIRGKDTTKDIPVVMISGKDGFFDKVRGKMAGTTGYITKPFGPETLMKAVETYLKGETL